MSGEREAHRDGKRRPDFDVGKAEKWENSRLAQPEIAENRKRGGDRRAREREEDPERENARRLRDRLVSMAS